MNRCPITYLDCDDDYSPEGLRLLNNRLTRLSPLPLSASEQRREALRLAGKLSIQGMQPKLSAVLSVARETFEPVERYGLYILKPQHADYPQLPENEGVTMHLARVASLDVPVSGLIYSSDRSMTYFIRRFDRAGRAGKLATEDFAQLAGRERETKYRFSMEGVAKLIDRHCSFPVLERARLFQRTVFCWLTGNEDMHLKNFSMIRRSGKVELSPLYDCLNTAVVYEAMGKPQSEIEELALPLNGKKRNITREDLLEYFGKSRLNLTGRVIEKTLERFSVVMPEWFRLIEVSYLNDKLKDLYGELLHQRRDILKI